MKEMWDERFAKKEYAYGKAPNEFFKQEIDKITPGRLLLLGEGEGRNGIYAATFGWIVDAVDWSIKGKEKAEQLALEQGVKINYIISDLSEYKPRENYYDAIGLVFIHLEPELRFRIHRNVTRSLKSGGVVILESYEKEQLNNSSGGPKDSELLYSLEDIFSDFYDLDILSFSKESVLLNESKIHSGTAEIIRYVGKKE
ncbi:hypothetical protein ASZ90_004702 [hydrocarbon metagenome]|uniref:Tellurite resistance methyltransferase TehB-like domain-containing protein n=1 Tax=hydrocarbon metagenome TaxID=938273 RepID=A0A0W8FX27_9ZZZZ